MRRREIERKATNGRSKGEMRGKEGGVGVGGVGGERGSLD